MSTPPPTRTEPQRDPAMIIASSSSCGRRNDAVSLSAEEHSIPLSRLPTSSISTNEATPSTQTSDSHSSSTTEHQSSTNVLVAAESPGPSPSQTTQPQQPSLRPPAERFSNPQAIPNTRPTLWLYQPTSFPRETTERFSTIVDILKSRVQESNLGEHVQEILYQLRLCGTSPEHATPTIVVFCPKTALRGLRKLFKAPVVRRNCAYLPKLTIEYYASSSGLSYSPSNPSGRSAALRRMLP